MRTPTWIALLAVSALTFGAPHARADDPSPAEVARAKVLFAEGEAAARAERWADAVDRFERVRAIKETPGVVFHLADAVERDDRPAAALRLFERARDLARAGDVADVLALADDRITVLLRRVPRLVVRGGDGATEVRLDGRPLTAAELGEPLRVEPGHHRVEGRLAEGPFEQDVELAEGALLTVVVGEQAPPATAPVPAPAAVRADPAPNEAPAPASAPLPLGPVLLGASGLALVAGGFVTFGVAGGEAAAGQHACDGGACDPGARDRVQTLDRVALGLWLGGGGALAGALVWWAVDDPAPTLQASAGPGGATLRGRF